MALTYLDIDRMLNDLTEKRGKLSNEKREVEGKLTLIKNRIRTNHNLPHSEYGDLCRKQSEYNKKRIEIDNQITLINDEHRRKHVIREELRNTQLPTLMDSVVKLGLTKLRDEYMQFASDLTRISSMRAMASKIAEELECFIKQM